MLAVFNVNVQLMHRKFINIGKQTTMISSGAARAFPGGQLAHPGGGGENEEENVTFEEKYKKN